jgi:dipeptidyl aminopeptidase/acylaminoacyl peptidase
MKMNRQVRTIASSVSLVVLFVALNCAGSTSAAAIDLRATELRQPTFDGWPLSLSPDGRRLAVARPSKLCLLDAATLAEEHCVDMAPKTGIDMETLAWSPDGRRLAFTEEAPRFLIDSDLWVLDAETGQLTDLTDDGIAGLNSALKPGALLDLAPAWSPDGSKIAFARSVSGAFDSSALYVIDANGGDPRHLTGIAAELFAVEAGVRWAPDGKTIYYSVRVHQSAQGFNGVWRVGVDGRNASRLFDARDARQGSPYLAELSARGTALLLYPDAVFGPIDFVPLFAVADLTTLRVSDIVPVDSTPLGTIAVATFSPDGSLLLLGDGNGRILVRDAASGDQRVLVEELDLLLIPRDFGGGMDWATNGLVFGTTGTKCGVLLRLVAG